MALHVQNSFILITLLFNFLVLPYVVGTNPRSKRGKVISGVSRNESVSNDIYHSDINEDTEEPQDVFDDFNPENAFPDIEYAFLGYNIFKGYPLAFGHDPGFTLPIFRAEHSPDNKSPDFRYNIPKGYVLIPDVACSTSFSSSIIKSRHELHKSLSTKVSFSGGGFGCEFSANTEYQESSTSISSGEYVIIHSSAHCHNYFAKMINIDPPPFSLHFKKWLTKLNESNVKQDYFDFFENYGTHFIKEVTLGSSLTFEHKMSQTSYDSMKSKKINIAASASYSGMFSIGGSVSLDKEQNEKASNFQKEVTTRTITTGATPPLNGNVMEWASVVKKNPVPVKHQISPIYYLFQSEFMFESDINFRAIGANVQKFSTPYFKYLSDRGHVNDFYDLIEFSNTKFFFGNSNDSYYMKNLTTISTDQCKQKCLEHQVCIAAYFVEDAEESDVWNFHTCHMFVTGDVGVINVVPEEMDGSTMIVVTSRIKYVKESWYYAFMVLEGNISGDLGMKQILFNNTSYQDCYDMCYNTTVQCAGITWDYSTKGCQLFGANNILSIKRHPMRYSTFLPPRKERTISAE